MTVIKARIIDEFFPVTDELESGLFRQYKRDNSTGKLTWLKMAITCSQLEDKLRSQLGATHVDVVDMSDGCGSKFKAIIVSPQFEGKPLLQRHRLVNSTIEEEMKIIHAFEMKTWTPEQYEKQKSNV